MIDDVVSPQDVDVIGDVSPDTAKTAFNKVAPFYTFTADPKTTPYVRLTIALRSKTPTLINGISFVVLGSSGVYYVLGSPTGSYPPSPTRPTDPTKASVVSAVFVTPVEAKTMTVYLRPVDETTIIQVSKLEIKSCRETGA